MGETERRTKSIRVRLSGAQLGRLEALASRIGMPPATLAALGVCRFLDEEWHRMEALDLLNEHRPFLRDQGGGVLYSTEGEPLASMRQLGAGGDVL